MSELNHGDLFIVAKSKTDLAGCTTEGDIVMFRHEADGATRRYGEPYVCVFTQERDFDDGTSVAIPLSSLIDLEPQGAAHDQ